MQKAIHALRGKHTSKPAPFPISEKNLFGAPLLEKTIDLKVKTRTELNVRIKGKMENVSATDGSPAYYAMITYALLDGKKVGTREFEFTPKINHLSLYTHIIHRRYQNQGIAKAVTFGNGGIIAYLVNEFNLSGEISFWTMASDQYTNGLYSGPVCVPHLFPKAGFATENYRFSSALSNVLKTEFWSSRSSSYRCLARTEGENRRDTSVLRSAVAKFKSWVENELGTDWTDFLALLENETALANFSNSAIAQFGKIASKYPDILRYFLAPDLASRGPRQVRFRP